MILQYHTILTGPCDIAKHAKTPNVRSVRFVLGIARWPPSRARLLSARKGKRSPISPHSNAPSLHLNYSNTVTPPLEHVRYWNLEDT